MIDHSEMNLEETNFLGSPLGSRCLAGSLFLKGSHLSEFNTSISLRLEWLELEVSSCFLTVALTFQKLGLFCLQLYTGFSGQITSLSVSILV